MGRAVIEAAVWPFMVVFGSPRSDPAPCFPEIAEPAGVKTLVAQPSVEAFNESVLNRLSRFNVIELDSVIDSPREKVTAGEFAAVIHANPFWSATLRDHTVQRTGNATAGQTGIDFQGEAFAGEGVDNRQYADRPPVGQTIVNEIERPLLIRLSGKIRRLSHAHQTLAFPAFHAQSSGPVNTE